MKYPYQPIQISPEKHKIVKLYATDKGVSIKTIIEELIDSLHTGGTYEGETSNTPGQPCQG